MSAPHQPIDRFAADLPGDRRESVLGSCLAATNKRLSALHQDFDNAEELRKLAAKIKQHALDHLPTYLEQAVDRLEEHGATVHFASGAEEARTMIHGLLAERGVERLVKAKSMVTEEIHLNEYLIGRGIECLETDLGEFIIQIDGDVPSHIIRPITHKNRREIAESFEREGLGAYNDDPEVITRRARVHLRDHYMRSQAGLTGGNFVSAESGRIVLVTNEGNARFSLAPNPVHIAVIGIEKIIPKDRDLGVFLNLLARSATGQRLTVYTQFIRGPKAPEQPSGPKEMHVIFLDNGRSDILKSDCREILRCIRCGACQNVCPVYRQASGHAYRSTYGGPIGAVLSPLLAGDDFAAYADLPKASSLCGACREVCPVDIPIPDMLLKLRNRAHEQGIRSPGSPPMAPFAELATRPAVWRTAMAVSRAANLVPASMIPVPALQVWLKLRTLPTWKGGEFRHWMRHRKP